MEKLSFLVDNLGMLSIISIIILFVLLGIILKIQIPKIIKSALYIAGISTVMSSSVYYIINNISLLVNDKDIGILGLNIIDIGWAPVAVSIWASAYTVYFIIIAIIVNMIMLKINKTNTLDVDIFNMWHLSVLGLACMYFSKSIILPTLIVIGITILKIINSDVLKPTFSKVAKMPPTSPTTSTHLVFMLNPIILIMDKIIDKVFPFLDKYDFDAAKLNKKIGFFGSKFAIGFYMGIFIVLIGGDRNIEEGIILGTTIGFMFEMLALIGGELVKSIDPFAQGVTNILSKKTGKPMFNIGIDWPFLASRSEIWAVTNILAPIMLIIAIILPENKVLPIGGIMALGLTPALLVMTNGKMLRMILMGIIMLPVYLISATLSAPFITSMLETISGKEYPMMISHATLDGPIERLIAMFLGKSWSEPSTKSIIYSVLAVAVYIIIFIWYKKQMEKRNELYNKEKTS